MSAQVSTVGWTHKVFALVLHLSCSALFVLAVVWPLAAPFVKGDPAAEFRPLLKAWQEWTAESPQR